jgi:hypothetical protein
MPLTNTLVVDLSGQTVTLNVMDGSNLVENLVYNQSGNTITFSIRPSVTISTADYSQLAAQLSLFHNAIINNFPLNQFQTSPFTSFLYNQTYISFISELNLEVTVNSTLFINDVTTSGSNTTSLNNRTVAQTLNYSEWALTYQALQNYSVAAVNFT